MNDDLFSTGDLGRVKAKILKELKLVERAPDMWGFSYLLSKVLDPEDFQALTVLEDAIEEEGVNKWLQDIMAKSGRYVADDDGYVIPIR